ncbi:hypothetical protein SCARR_03345 [Pontiella sulfatireligans]|uniref:Uncharacterized protein n=1 Tax=Pontiella sulfatireligans TaxID=2750658 RepID=A0A6C2UMV2_9BACT|nr:hypothetical protein SCARR_03345 [Pontiella sulfatireligans]
MAWKEVLVMEERIGFVLLPPPVPLRFFRSHGPRLQRFDFPRDGREMI